MVEPCNIFVAPPDPVPVSGRVGRANIPVFHHSNRTTWRPFGPELNAEGLNAEGLSTGCEQSGAKFYIPEFP